MELNFIDSLVQGYVVQHLIEHKVQFPDHLKSARVIDPELADALGFFNNGGVGIEVPLDRCRFLVTTNKKFASVQNLKGNASKRVMHEVAIRDRVVYRAFDLSSDESWGWLASVAIAEDIFKDDNFTLTDEQLLLLLKTFHQNWDKLTSCSMRAVKDAAATLYNYPNEFTDIFNRNYCG